MEKSKALNRSREAEHRFASRFRLADYPAETLFVVYCAGANCNGADRAAVRIARLGRPVKKMIGGIEGWKLDGVLLRGRLPQFDLVALRIDDPPKLAVLRVIDLVENIAAFRFERGDQSVKVLDAVVDHERGVAGSKLLAFLRRNQPRRLFAYGLPIRVGHNERGAAPRLHVDAEVTLVPSPQRGCVLRFEEDAADAGDSLHVNL